MKRAKPPQEWKQITQKNLNPQYLLGFLLIVAVIFIAGAIFWIYSF